MDTSSHPIGKVFVYWMNWLGGECQSLKAPSGKEGFLEQNVGPRDVPGKCEGGRWPASVDDRSLTMRCLTSLNGVDLDVLRRQEV